MGKMREFATRAITLSECTGQIEQFSATLYHHDKFVGQFGAAINLMILRKQKITKKTQNWADT